MAKKKVIPRIMAEPKPITSSDKTRLREMLEFILSGTYFAGDKAMLENMMKSESRVACLAFIESMIGLNKTVNQNNMDDFFHAYLDDTIVRMNVTCKITEEFRSFDFSADKKMGMKLCLIIGELITNSLKHGISAGRKKMPVIIAMGPDPIEKEWFSFLYMDQGVGINENQEMYDKEQYGLSIAHAIIESLEGEFDVSTFEKGGVGIQCRINHNKLHDIYN